MERVERRRGNLICIDEDKLVSVDLEDRKP